MKRIAGYGLILLVATAPVMATGGVDFGIKGGLISHYRQPGLNVAGYDLEQMNLFGGQFYISAFPKFDLIAGVDYGWRSQTYAIAGQGFEFKMRDFAVTASAVYPVKLSAARLYIGAGLGSHSISYEYVRPLTLSLADNGVTIPEATTYVGYHGLIGAKVAMPRMPLGVFLEGKYTEVSTPGDNIRFASFSGGIFVSLP